MEGYNPLYDILILGIPTLTIGAYLAWDWFYKKMGARKS
tara:strand:- start:217 stop:333 length:117 start_codon:yes stop_codon:yes gene_type:complete